MFLIRSLGPGGAERQLVNLAKGLRQLNHNVVVVTFYSGEWLEEELVAAGVTVWTLKKRGRWDIIGSGLKLFRIVRETRPSVLHSYLTTANLLALLPKLCFPSTKLVWGIRASDVDYRCYDWFSRLSFQAECVLSNLPDLIIANSCAGRDYHCERGFPKSKVFVIHNGIDMNRFEPDKKAGEKVRREWKIQEGELLIGLVGRLDPMKDHPTFLKTAGILARQRESMRFVCVGDGPSSYKQKLQSLAAQCGLGSKLVWAGSRKDMRAVYNACNVIVNSSAWGEGLCNALLEAMACGVPCAATDVGDSAVVINDQSMVVKAGDVGALTTAINSALSASYHKSPHEVREHVKKNFGMDAFINLSQKTLQRLLS